MKTTKLQLGDTVKDSITGFQGIAVGRTAWLYGCDRIGVEPREMKDGKTIDIAWFDEARLVVLKAGTIRVAQVSTGGPRPDPVRGGP